LFTENLNHSTRAPFQTFYASHYELEAKKLKGRSFAARRRKYIIEIIKKTSGIHTPITGDIPPLEQILLMTMRQI